MNRIEVNNTTRGAPLVIRMRLLPRPGPVRRFFMPNPYSPLWQRYRGLKLLKAALNALPVKESRRAAWLALTYHALTGKLITWDVQ